MLHTMLMSVWKSSVQKRVSSWCLNLAQSSKSIKGGIKESQLDIMWKINMSKIKYHH